MNDTDEHLKCQTRIIDFMGDASVCFYICRFLDVGPDVRRFLCNKDSGMRFARRDLHSIHSSYKEGSIMTNKSIVLTEADFDRLQWLIDSLRVQCHRDAERLDELEAELMRATVVESCKVSGDVVTMNSRVRIKDLNTGRELAYQIVFPKDANVAKNRISVLAPIGTALLGNRVGATVKWRVPSGLRRFVVMAVDYQPESAKT